MRTKLIDRPKRRKMLPPRPPKTDQRLLGTWRSDKQRTLKEWAFKPRTARKYRRTIRDLFGKLRITYTRKQIRWVLGDWQQTQKYQIVGRDACSLAIVYWDPLEQDWRIQYIRFDGRDSYWVPIGWNREFFKRVR